MSEWEAAGLTPQEMWDEIQAVRVATGDDGTHGSPHLLVEHQRDQATGIREIVEHQRDTALRELDEALAMVAELAKKIRENQFCSWRNDPGVQCPDCGQPEDKGHAEDCELDALATKAESLHA